MIDNEIIRRYIESVNSHDLGIITDMMAEDFVFIDSVGNRLEGKDNMRVAWEKYFTLFPDYSMSVEEVFNNDDIFILVGTAKGTYCPYGNFDPADNWEVPAVWKVNLQKEKICRWQVFADNTGLFQIINRYPGMGFLA